MTSQPPAVPGEADAASRVLTSETASKAAGTNQPSGDAGQTGTVATDNDSLALWELYRQRRDALCTHVTHAWQRQSRRN